MVDEKRLVQRFVQYAACASESGHERQMCLLLERQLQELGLDVFRDDVRKAVQTDGWNVYASLPGTGEPMLFSAHMDTVCPGSGVKPVLRDGTIYSSGDTILGADDKAGIAEILEALTCLHESGLPHRPIEVLFTVREETGLEGSANACYDRIRSKTGVSFDSGPIGRIVIENPIQQVLFLQVQGKASHSGSHYDDGIHALKCAADMIAQIPCGHVDADTAVNVANFLSPGQANSVPDLASFEIEIRCFSAQKLETFREKLREIFERVTQSYGAQYTLRTELHSPGMQLDREHPLVGQVCAVYEALGIEPKIARTYGGHDGVSFAAHGLAAANLGCGFAGCHSLSEHVRVEDLTRGARVALGLMTCCR